MPYDPTKDLFALGGRGGHPAIKAVAVTPSDSTDLAIYARSLYVGVAGDVAVLPIDNLDGASVVFKSHPVGYMPVAARRVLATGTTATNILALI